MIASASPRKAIAPLVPSNSSERGLDIATAPHLEAGARLTIKLIDGNAFALKITENRMPIRPYDNKRGRPGPFHKLPNARLKDGTILYSPYAASHRSDAQHPLHRKRIEAVVPGLLSTPAGIWSNWNAALVGTVLHNAHLVELITLKRLGKIRIRAEINASDTIEMRGDHSTFSYRPAFQRSRIPLRGLTPTASKVLAIATPNLIPAAETVSIAAARTSKSNSFSLRSEERTVVPPALR